MPDYRRLTAEELAKMRSPVTGERARVREQYRGYIADLEEGQGAELRLRGDENKTTVKNRLKRAAKDLGVGLRFQRSGSDVVIFQVTSRE